MDLTKIKDVPVSTLVQFPDRNMQIGLILSCYKHLAVIRVLGEERNFTVTPDTLVHPLDLQAMAREMERLSERGTVARRYLVGLIRMRDRNGVWISDKALSDADVSEIIYCAPDPHKGGMAIGLRYE